MPFHLYSSIDYLFVFGQCHLYCYNRLRKCQNLVDTHIDIG